MARIPLSFRLLGERDQPAVDLPALASLIAELSKWIAGRSMAGGARCKSGHRQCRRLHHRRCANAGFANAPDDAAAQFQH